MCYSCYYDGRCFMLESFKFIITYIIILVFIVIIWWLKNRFSTKTNQNSYHIFAKFIDNKNVTFNDDNFNEKLFKIKTAIKNGKRDIKLIAKETNCTFEECILKIKYLEEKKIITNFHIDHKNNRLVKCSAKDLKLIKQYIPFVYRNHFTLDEITVKKRISSTQNYEALRDKIFNELKYLVDNDLINGIRINEVDKEIIYYSNEKEKRRDFITMTCPNCGAINDINRGGKVRCEYCSTILEDKTK